MNIHPKSPLVRYDKTKRDRRIKVEPRLDFLMLFFNHGYLSTSMVLKLSGRQVTTGYLSTEMKLLKREPNCYIEQSDELKYRFQAFASELIYRITEHGVEALLRYKRITMEDAELWHKLHSRPRPGQYWHDVATSFTTASIELGCRELGFRFISTYEIIRNSPQATKDLSVPISMPSGDKRTVPDALCGFDDGNQKTYLATETDFGTEQGAESEKKQSTISGKYKAYRHIWRHQTFTDQFGIPNLKLLFTFLHLYRTRIKKADFIAIAEKDATMPGVGPVYFRCIPELNRRDSEPLASNGTMLVDQWERIKGDPVYLYKKAAT